MRIVMNLLKHSNPTNVYLHHFFGNVLLVFILSIFVVGCKNGIKNDIVKQAKPTIMVIPSDNLLKKNGALKKENIDGAEIYIRDYNSYLVNDTKSKTAISIIQKAFINAGYPLNDLDKNLKQLNDRGIRDEADGVKKDAKTLLIEAVQPDIIIELDYSYDMDMNSQNFDREISYTLTAIDAYTNKVFSSNVYSGGKGKDFRIAFENAIDDKISSMMSEIDDYFGDIVENGREITVQFSIDKNSFIKFSDTYSSTGESYSEWIQDYMDYYTINGTYKLERNSDYEMYFVNVRIPTQKENGTQFNALGWARQCVKVMREKLKVSSSNRAQGLSEVVINIK